MNTIPQQITYRHALARQLGLTYLQYENLRYEFYINWCIHLLTCPLSGVRGLHLKTLLTHDTLLNWYDDQWYALVEQTIHRHYRQDISIYTPEEMLDLISFYAANILDYYPSVLLKKITAPTAHNGDEAETKRRRSGDVPNTNRALTKVGELAHPSMCTNTAPIAPTAPTKKQKNNENRT